MKNSVFFLFILCLLALSSNLWSVVYEWRDEFGNVVISNLTPEGKVKYRVIDVERETVRFKSVWDIRNKATEKLEKMLRKIEEEKQKMKEATESETKTTTKTVTGKGKKEGWLPLVGKAQNSSGEIVVSAVEENPKKHNLPYDIFKVKIENLGGITIKFSRVFTKIQLKNDEGVTHSYLPKKVALKKELPFADKIPEDESLGPAEKKSYILAFSPVRNPTVMVFDKFVNVDDGYVEVDLIRKEVERKAPVETQQVKVEEEKSKQNLKLGDFGQLQGENIFKGGAQKLPPLVPKSPQLPKPQLPLPPISPVSPARNVVQKEVPIDPLLGLRVRKVDSELQKKLNLRSTKGLYVEKVIMDSPAYNGGLKKGDIIETVNNQDVNSVEKLKEIIENASRGDSLNFFVNRNNTWENFTVIKR